jgi:hypothetical protein
MTISATPMPNQFEGEALTGFRSCPSKPCLLPFQALPPALKRLRVSLPEAGIGRSARCLLEVGKA